MKNIQSVNLSHFIFISSPGSTVEVIWLLVHVMFFFFFFFNSLVESAFTQVLPHVMLCYIHLLHYIIEGNVIIFTQIHLYDS